MGRLHVRTLLPIAIGAVSLLFGSSSYAYINGNSNSCELISVGTGPVSCHTGSGYSNCNANDSYVECPLALGMSSNYSYTVSTNMGIRYLDYNASSGEAVQCQVGELFSNFSWASSTPLFSCSTSGGCTSGTNTYEGTGALVWSPSQLGSTDTLYVDANVSISCQVPGEAGGLQSVLYGYWAN